VQHTAPPLGSRGPLPVPSIYQASRCQLADEFSMHLSSATVTYGTHGAWLHSTIIQILALRSERRLQQTAVVFPHSILQSVLSDEARCVISRLFLSLLKSDIRSDSLPGHARFIVHIVSLGNCEGVVSVSSGINFASKKS
jgi:hypothetical protein